MFFCLIFFFFKQKTAYEMRISDWSSDVCSSDLISWLLLPPDYKPGTRLATIVNVYPGARCRETYTRWQLDDMHALNDQILVAKGYAVLYPCIPVAYHKVPRDPLDGLVEEVFSAVDAAAARGYVDPKRLAVQGQSYGGYTTRPEEHTSELQSLMRISYAVFCLQKKKKNIEFNP